MCRINLKGSSSVQEFPGLVVHLVVGHEQLDSFVGHYYYEAPIHHREAQVSTPFSASIAARPYFRILLAQPVWVYLHRILRYSRLQMNDRRPLAV